MNKSFGTALLSLAVGLGIVLPAGAAGSADSTDSNDSLAKVVRLPITLTALAAGIAVGTPIAVLRDTVNDYPQARDSVAKQLAGENQTPDVCQNIVADVAAVPFGITVGVLDGIYHGTINAVDNCEKKPFSAESFCLTDSCFSRTH